MTLSNYVVPGALLVGALIVVVGLARNHLRSSSAGGLLFLLGMCAVYAGERLYGADPLHWAVTGLGLVLVAASMGVRARAASDSVGVSKKAQQQALIWSAVATGSLLLYALSTPAVTGALGFTGDAAARWSTVWKALFPIVWLVGTLPMLQLDRAVSIHPVVMPPNAIRLAARSGVVTGLALALVFPVNYLANAEKVEWDLAYFRTARASGTSQGIARTLTEPVTATLFFAPASEVKEQILPYFESLAAVSDGRLTVRVVDQPLNPKLAEELKVRENGYIVFQQGEQSEKFKINTDIDRARRDLRKLDSNVQKYLMKIGRGQRTAYLLAGHGEASPRETGDEFMKLQAFKKGLETLNYKVKDFGLTEGSAVAVPDDAALVVVAAPEKDLLPEEERALVEYAERGGALLVALDPGRATLNGVLAPLGITVTGGPLANGSVHLARTRGPEDKAWLATNRYGSHQAVSTLSKYSSRAILFVPTAVGLDEVKDKAGKVTPLIRSMPDTWLDADGDYTQGPDEKGQVHVIAYASEGKGETPHRAVVIGDVSLFSDPAFKASVANQQLAQDVVLWLVGDEELQGDVSSEEDVKIVHTTEEDKAWFYGTIFGVPFLVLVTGTVFTRIRRRSR